MARKTTIDCATCGGSGTVSGRYTDPAPVACPDCHGSGTVKADAEDAPSAEGV